LAAKFWDDEFMNDAHYAKVGGVSPVECAALQARFLKLIDWRLYVLPEEYDAYLQHVLASAPCQHVCATGTVVRSATTPTTRISAAPVPVVPAVVAPTIAATVAAYAPRHGKALAEATKADFTVNASNISVEKAASVTTAPEVVACTSTRKVEASLPAQHEGAHGGLVVRPLAPTIISAAPVPVDPAVALAAAAHASQQPAPDGATSAAITIRASVISAAESVSMAATQTPAVVASDDVEKSAARTRTEAISMALPEHEMSMPAVTAESHATSIGGGETPPTCTQPPVGKPQAAQFGKGAPQKAPLGSTTGSANRPRARRKRWQPR